MAKPKPEPTTKGPQIIPAAPPAYVSHPIIDRWALVVGVSEYEHAEKGISNLRFAHHDAERFSAKLKTPACGSFPDRNVRLLTNKEATLSQVQRALRSFLAEPKEDDLVIIYFSCHGASDPRRPDQRYFFTYDTDPGDIAREAHLCATNLNKACGSDFPPCQCGRQSPTGAGSVITRWLT